MRSSSSYHARIGWIGRRLPRCGNFSITWEALEELDRLGATVAISGIAREWTELGRALEINKDNLSSLINFAPNTIKDRRQHLLRAIARRYPEFQTECDLHMHNDCPLAYVSSSKPFNFILRYLLAEKLVNWMPTTGETQRVALTPRGWEEVESVGKPAAMKDKAFVAMWFMSS